MDTTQPYENSPQIINSDKKILRDASQKYVLGYAAHKYIKLKVGIISEIAVWLDDPNTWIKYFTYVLKVITQVSGLGSDNLRFYSYGPAETSGYALGDYIKATLATRNRLLETPSSSFKGSELQWIVDNSDILVVLGLKSAINIYPVRLNKPFIIICAEADLKCKVPGLLYSKPMLSKVANLDLRGQSGIMINSLIEIVRNHTSLIELYVIIQRWYMINTVNPMIKLLNLLSNNKNLKTLYIKSRRVNVDYLSLPVYVYIPINIYKLSSLQRLTLSEIYLANSIWKLMYNIGGLVKLSYLSLNIFGITLNEGEAVSLTDEYIPQLEITKLNILKRFTNLTEFYLRSVFEDSVVDLINHFNSDDIFKKLKVLRIINRTISPRTTILSFPTSLSNLETLTIDDVSHLAKMDRKFSKLKKLRTLVYRETPRLFNIIYGRNEHLWIIGQLINLTKLRLSITSKALMGTRKYGGKLHFVASDKLKYLMKLVNLTELRIVLIDFKPSRLYIPDEIKNLTKLEILEMTGSTVFLGNGIKELKKLRVFQSNDPKFIYPNLKVFKDSNATPKTKDVEYNFINNGKIERRSWSWQNLILYRWDEMLYQYMKSWPNLEELILGSARISNYSWNYMIEKGNADYLRTWRISRIRPGRSGEVDIHWIRPWMKLSDAMKVHERNRTIPIPPLTIKKPEGDIQKAFKLKIKIPLQI